MSSQDHSLMGNISSVLQTIREKTTTVEDEPSENSKTNSNLNKSVTNNSHFQSNHTNKKHHTQSLLTTSFLTNIVSKNYGTIREKPCNPYAKAPIEKISHQRRINTCRDSDNKWIGIKIYEKKPHVARVWAQNLNGISTKNSFAGFADTLVTMNRFDVQFFSFCETNLNCSNMYTRDSIEAVTNSVMPASQLKISSTTSTHSSESFQYGGNLSIAHGLLSARFATSGSDKYGRFHWMQFFGRNSHLRIYNVYNPVTHNDNTERDGSVWIQHRNALQNDGVQTKPNQHLIDTIINMIREDLKKDRQVIVTGDFNTSVLDIQLNSIFDDVGLSNVYDGFISKDTDARSWFRGKTIIDGAWCTPLVKNNIQAVGLAPFYFIHPSDHRALIFDFDVRMVLDDNEVELLPSPYRRLRSSVPSRVKSYSTLMEDGWFMHNIQEKIDDIEGLFYREGSSPEAIEKLNNLDTVIQSIFNNSEKKCCNVGRHNDVFYSVHFAKIIKRERLIKCELRRESMKNSFKFASKKIKKLLVELKTTRREKREAKAKDVSFRDKHLDECAAQYSRDHPGISIPNAVKQLKHIEKQKREARRIRRALKGKRSGALTYVLIPTAESYSDEIRNLPNFDHSNMEFIWPRVQVANGHDVESWEIVNDKEKVETLTLACMRKHFAQSQGTPFTSDDWIDKLSDKDIQNAIIAGQYDVSQHPEAIQLYLRALKRPKDHPPELKFEYSYSGFCQFIRKADEQTSASPSGRHYGHYKVLLKNCQHILFDVYRIMKLAFSNGIFLERYRRTVTTLIAKELNRPRIHRLRPIHIVEIELQAITKSQWAKNLINRAEKLNLITDSQYGGRCQRQAQSMVLNRTLIFDITRHMVKPLTCVDEDLKACYDRELAPLGALEDRYFGNSHEQGDYIIQATQKQNFFVKTNFGISKTAYCYTPENKIWGLGQGLGWSGARWTLTSSIIDKIMNERCSGLLFQGPKRDLSFTKLTDMFVDDLNQFCNHYPPNSSLVKQTTHNVQLHSDLVYTSGGILALDKCKYYHVDFYFDQDGKSHMFTKDQLPSEMQIKSALNEVPVVIEHIDSHNPHETLGYIITPSGNHKELYKIVENHVNDWVKHVTSSSLFPHEKILSYHTVLVPQVAYRLVGASFTYEECETLMKRIYPIMINAHGFHRSFSRAMAEAPYICRAQYYPFLQPSRSI